MKVRKKSVIERVVLVVFTLFLGFSLFFGIIGATPQGPTSISTVLNETRSNTAPIALNISGGYISTLNINATTQNVRWKGHVGNVTGKLSLDDGNGSTFFDWTLSTITGEIYATRNSTTPLWTNLRCANATLLERENVLMNHTSADDNISKTFNGTTHASFVAGSVAFGANTCPTLNTYRNNVTQDTDFEEMALTDLNSTANFTTTNGNIIYTTILESDLAGFDGNTYDFQLLIPENGAPGFSSATTYYIYVELG